MHRVRIAIVSFIAIAMMAMQVPAWADEEHRCCKIDWARLNLTSEQAREIEQLDGQFKNEYNTMKPIIDEEKRKLAQLLADHSSDPVEIMALEQSLGRKRAELRTLATTNYLKKRQVLNEQQQCSLETMIRQAMKERQQASNSNSGWQEAMPDRIHNLIQKVRNILPAQPER